MRGKIVLALAPTGGWGSDHNNPIVAEHIRDEVLECAELGVSWVHLHSRDAEGRLSADPSYYMKTCSLIRAESDIIIEASTGGLSDMSTADRVRTVEAKETEFASFNMGSLNFGDKVYNNSLPDIRYWLGEIRAAGKIPNLEIFDTGNLATARALIDEGLLASPLNYNFIFNAKWGMPYTVPLLSALRALIDPRDRWGGIFFAHPDFSMHVETILLGATHTRIGFEDSRYDRGKEMKSNVEIVKAFKRVLDAMEIECATPSEARIIMNVAT
ncbi:3-keto-5-aminohexanoate cleavage protein [Treponema sp.]